MGNRPESELYTPNNYAFRNYEDGMGREGRGRVRSKAKKVRGGEVRRKPLSSRAGARWRFYVRVVVN
jgi:hypothetical protein